MLKELLSTLTVDGVTITSINQINDLPSERRESFYRELIPEEVFTRFDIDPATGLNAAGQRVVTYVCPPRVLGFRIASPTEAWMASRGCMRRRSTARPGS